MTTVWPWLLILAGTCLIVGALIYRQRMLSRYYDELEGDDGEASDTPRATGSADTAHGRDHSTTPSGDSHADARPAGASSAGATATSGATSMSSSTERSDAARAGAESRQEPRADAGPETRGDSRPAPVAHPAPSGPDPYAGLPDSHLLAEAPTVTWGEANVVLHDWMRYYTDGNVWSDVLSSFTEGVDADPELRSYFTATPDGSVSRHSLSTLMMLTTQGITVGDVRRMKAAHASVKNERGEPINAFVWNQLVDVLSNALRESGVRDGTLAKLGATLEPLRGAIVPSPDHR